MPLDLKALARDRRAWAVAGAGGALGVGVSLYRRRHGPGAPAGNGSAAAGGSLPYVSGQPSVYDSSLQDIAAGFDQTRLDLQRQIDEINAQLQQPTPPGPTSPPPPTPRPSTPTPKRGLRLRRVGRVGRTYNLRAIARQSAPNPSSAGSVEAELRRIVRANPELRGRTSIPGGFALRVPR